MDAVRAAVAEERVKDEEEQRVDEARKAEARAKAKAEADAKAAAKAARPPWTPEELGMLGKAIKKFPAGYRQRWETIASFLETTLQKGTNRTMKECLEQARMINNRTEPSLCCCRCICCTRAAAAPSPCKAPHTKASGSPASKSTSSCSPLANFSRANCVRMKFNGHGVPRKSI